MNNSHSPTHEAISQRAEEIWQARGKPTDQDTAIWLTAEQQLRSDLSQTSDSDPIDPPSSFDPFGSNHSPSTAPDPLETAAKSDQLKHAASAPQLPTHKNAPRQAPTASGKPLWKQPHSS